MDAYYTPEVLAHEVARAVDGTARVVADFTCGTGELLRAAIARWPAVHVIATDINRAVVARLAAEQPAWTVKRCDFLSETSRRRCKALEVLRGRIDAAVLNPPFSGRGASTCHVQLGDVGVSCSKALAVVILALGYLKPGGVVSAILPEGCLNSDKDRAGWSLIRRTARVRIVSRHGKDKFNDCSASTVLLTLRVRHRPIRPSSRRARVAPALPFNVVRGTYPMHHLPGPGPLFPVIHTTELRDGRVLASDRYAGSKWRQVSGPALLLPRVGQPSRSKVSVLRSRDLHVLSDCVIAIKCRNIRLAIRLREQLLARWPMLESAYSGTCAKYLTLDRLCSVLRRVPYLAGVRGAARIVGAG